MEDIERYTYRQNNRIYAETACFRKTVTHVRENIKHPKTRSEQVVHHVCEEIGVLEISQQTEVNNDGQTQPCFRLSPFAARFYPPRNQPIAYRDKRQDEKKQTACLVVKEPTDE